MIFSHSQGSIIPIKPEFMRIFRQGSMVFNFDGVRVHWFPLHMRRAMDKMSQSMKQVDVVIEVRDARIPISSQNQRFEHLLAKKERIVVYNKCDLAEEQFNKVSLSLFS